MLAARVDNNQAEIVQALQKAGALVLSLANVGRGCPDLLIFYPSRNRTFQYNGLYLQEVKTEHGRLTPDQVRFFEDWPVTVVRSAEEALRAIGALDEYQ